MEQKNYYNVYDYADRLAHGKSAKIEHSISANNNTGLRISEYKDLSVEQIQELRKQSVEREEAAFNRIRESMSEWENVAADTMLLDLAEEYVKTTPVKHSGNQWVEGEYRDMEISNMTYEMSYRIYEETRYDRETKESVPVAWQLNWSVRTNAPRHNTSYPIHNETIAGQDRKRFISKSDMQKYLDGRIKAYAHLFTEISPPIPKYYEKNFTVNGMLLPGYTISAEREIPKAPRPQNKTRRNEHSR